MTAGCYVLLHHTYLQQTHVLHNKNYLDQTAVNEQREAKSLQQLLSKTQQPATDKRRTLAASNTSQLSKLCLHLQRSEL